MKEENACTYSNKKFEGKIDAKALDEARELLELPEQTDEEVAQMIATLAKTKGWETYGLKIMPKGKVIIGLGDPANTNFPSVKSKD